MLSLFDNHDAPGHELLRIRKAEIVGQPAHVHRIEPHLLIAPAAFAA